MTRTYRITEFISLLLLQEKQHNEILKNSILRDQVVRTTLEEHLARKRPAEEASPIITSPPNLRDRSHRTNEPSGSSSVMFFSFLFVM